MKSRTPIVISEFGTLYEEGAAGVKSLTDSPLPAGAFEDLWEFCHDGKSGLEKVFRSDVCRNGKRKITVLNHVGTIQTRDGTVIEILPKIYTASNREESDRQICRMIFLRMLAALKPDNFVRLSDAELLAKRHFPILEIYISNYISAVEDILRAGLGRNYAGISANEKFFKGRLLVSRHICKNSADKSRFFINYSRYDDDIPQNRIIVSTLLRLRRMTSDPRNSSGIGSLLSRLCSIPESSNVEMDLEACMSADRMMDRYRKIVVWSGEILRGNGFTTFSGSCVNHALLFKAERLFESFIARLFRDYCRKYLPGVRLFTQHTGHYLIDSRQTGGDSDPRFSLRPDIFMESYPEEHPFRPYSSVIIDTKWKNIDVTDNRGDYNMSGSDMNQLYAYGRKYQKNKAEEFGVDHIPAMNPRLILVYPYNDKCTGQIPDYIYDRYPHAYNLRMSIVAFDLTGGNCAGLNVLDNYYGQIRDILKRAFGDVLFLARRDDSDHLEWAVPGAKVRLKKTVDAVSAPSALLLYNGDDPDDFSWYRHEKDSDYSLDRSPGLSPSHILTNALGVSFLDEESFEIQGVVYRKGAPVILHNYTELL